jgi:hypothetical protein
VLNITVRDDEVRMALASMMIACRDLRPRLVPKSRRLALALLADAKSKTPIDEGTLRRSGQYDVKVIASDISTTITFGGLASAYAEVQHENDSFTHTRGELASRMGRRAASSLKTRSVTIFGKRKPKKALKIRGYKGGQAHWLFGRQTSAWTSRRASAYMREMLREAVNIMTPGGG